MPKNKLISVTYTSSITQVVSVVLQARWKVTTCMKQTNILISKIKQILIVREKFKTCIVREMFGFRNSF